MRVVDTDLTEQTFHTERTRFVRDDRNDVLTNVLIFQQDVQSFQQKVERGELSPVQQQTEQSRLEKRQQELAGEEQGMVQQIQDKRTELLEPIYDSLNEAIASVAKENGYTFIFDKQVLLYSEESQDVSEAVKAKINI